MKRSKTSRNARRRLKQKVVEGEKAEAENKAAEWLVPRTEPDFGADDEKPKVRLPLRPAGNLGSSLSFRSSPCIPRRVRPSHPAARLPSTTTSTFSSQLNPT